jgi:hypothetical protein
MRRHSVISASAFLALLMVATQSYANESTTHRTTSGTFGVAWIASEGLIYTYSPAQKAAPFRVNNVRAHQLAAIDYDADGRDELAIIHALNKSLSIHDFDDSKMIGPFGHNVAEITVGRFEPNEKFESIMACTYSGATFLWNQKVGGEGWIPLPGDFERAYRGKVVSRLRTDAVVTVSRGDVYTLNPVWKTYGQVLLGKDAKLAIPCDLSAYPGEEIVVACGKDQDLFVCKKKTAEPLGQKAIAMTRGKLATDKDTIFAVTPGGTIAQYLPKEKVWKDFQADVAWADAILQDTDGDGQGELFAVPSQAPEELHQYDAKKGAFVKLPHRLLDNSGQSSAVRPDSTSENVTLSIDGKPVCDCKFWNTTHKPYVIRMYTPGGRNILRDSPADHIHHHGLMFAIKADGCDFWAETPGQPHGKMELAELTESPSGASATLTWKNAEGVEVMREQRTLTAIPYDKATLLTWSSELSKAKRAKVTLGGSHYFGLGMRFAQSMDNGGTFRFSADRKESTVVRGDERVTQASWAAYTAKLNHEDPATAVIFSHPDNFRPMHAFTMGDNSAAFAFLSATLNLYRESYEWENDDKLKLRWGIAMFDGDPSQEAIEAAYGDWKSTEEQGNR